MNSIIVSTATSTDLSSITPDAEIERIEVQGKGCINVCTLSFAHGDELDVEQYTAVIFTKTDHPSECILTPHKPVCLSDYSYFVFKMFSGKLDATDKVILYYSNKS